MDETGKWTKIEFRWDGAAPIPIIPDALFGRALVLGGIETMVDEETGDILMRALDPREGLEEAE